MPALLDMLQAIPRCRARRMIRHGQRGEHFTCHERLHYSPDRNEWWCSSCGTIVPGAIVASFHVELEAA